MNLGKISYLGELFNSLQMALRETASGELNAHGLVRRYRMMTRILRQISATSDALADSLDVEIDELCAEIVEREAHRPAHRCIR